MVQSIGVDIVDIARMTEVIQRWGDRFLNKVLTPVEYNYCKEKPGQASSVAARFAVKEAFYKALPHDIQIGVGWLDIQVMNDETGRPHVNCLGNIKNLGDRFNIHVSISHSKSSAVGIIVLEEKGTL